MTNEQLDVIDGVLKEATPGPLNYEIGDSFGYWTLTDAKGNIVADDVRTDDVKGGANASLFINAHLWCSDLLAEVRRLKDLLACLLDYPTDAPTELTDKALMAIAITQPAGSEAANV